MRIGDSTLKPPRLLDVDKSSKSPAFPPINYSPSQVYTGCWYDNEWLEVSYCIRSGGSWQYNYLLAGQVRSTLGLGWSPRSGLVWSPAHNKSVTPGQPSPAQPSPAQPRTNFGWKHSPSQQWEGVILCTSAHTEAILYL